MELFKKFGAFFFDITQTVVTSLAIFLVIYLIVARPHQVSGQSMYPNFHNGDFILTNLLTYRFNQPKRGDVIVFKAPPSPSDEFIKRIIGIPGDRVSVKDGHVYINGELEPDLFLPADTITNPGKFMTEGKETVVGPEEYLVMGDNRPGSSDSREWGLVPRGNIVGIAFWRYWPPEKFGKIEETHF